MQVCKCFFRILNKQKGQIIMYLVIFMAISMLVSSQGKDSAEAVFETSSCSFAVFDEDGSELSRGLTDYLSAHNEKKEVEDDRETIQDQIYDRHIVCAIRIPNGFGEAVQRAGADGGSEEVSENLGETGSLEIITLPGTVYGEIFETEVNGYLRVFRSYVSGGFPVSEAVKRTEAALAGQVEVELADSRNDGTHSKLYYYFNVLPYIYIAICIVAVGPILIVFNKKDVRDRIRSSPYLAGKINFELYLGMALTGLGLAAVHFSIMAACRVNVFTRHGLLYLINEICFLVIPLGITFLIGQIVTGLNVLSMMANVVGLGFSFLGGVFVPLEMMSDGILRVAHFIPSYWYVRACGWIDQSAAGDSAVPLLEFMGIELLFGVAFICAGLAYSKRRRA